MIRQAVGIIEVLGFASLVEVADVCLKTANVKLEGYEKTGGNWGIIKITGDIGAVKASISSGSAKAREYGHFIGSTILARPGQGLEPMIYPMDEDGAPGAERS